MKKTILTLMTTLLASFLLSVSALAATHTFKANAVVVDGTKYWFPSSFTVKKGDTVKFELKSTIPGKGSVHGFAIDAFKVKETVDEKGKTVEFVADQAGIFPIYCQLHPGHVGGQLVVLE